MEDAYEFWKKKLGNKKREKNFFFKFNIKDDNVCFTDIYTIKTIETSTWSNIKESLKKCLRLFNKTFSKYQATYLKEIHLLFEKSGNFYHRVSIEIGLTPSLPVFVFIGSSRTPLPSSATNLLL